MSGQTQSSRRQKTVSFETALLEIEQGRNSKIVLFKPFILSRGGFLEDVEKGYILEALRTEKGNEIQVAKMLGISRSAFLYRMQKYGVKTGV